MAPVTVTHQKKTGAAANPAALVDGVTWDTDPHVVTGLDQVNNTSDANKPVSGAQALAIAAAQAAAIAAITPTSLGLGNVNNTSDANKPVSTAQAAANAVVAAAAASATALKANIAGPTFTGTLGVTPINAFNVDNSVTIGQGTGANGEGGSITVKRQNGAIGSPTAILAGDELGFFQSQGWDGTTFAPGGNGNPTAVVLVATENWSNTSHGQGVLLQATPNGTLGAVNEVSVNNGLIALAPGEFAKNGNGPGSITAERNFFVGQSGVSTGSLLFFNATSGSIQLTSPVGALGSAVNTLQAVTDTVVYRATTDTLTNKTLTSPTLTTPNIGAATGTSTSLTGGNTLYNATAVPAGGTTGTGLKMSSVSNLGVFFGSGVPTLSAAQGSLYMRTDGSSASTRMYINTNGSTTWTNVTTAA